MASKKEGVNIAEYMIPGIHIVEPFADIIGSASSAVAVLGRMFPPLAYILEAGVGLFELMEDRHSKHLTNVDKAAQVFVTGCVILAGALAVTALAVSALSPLMPVATLIATAVIGLGAFHRAYLKYKDPAYTKLNAERTQLKTELAEELNTLDNKAVKKILMDKNLTLNQKKNLINKDTKGLSDKIWQKVAVFGKKTNDYKERQQEIRTLGAKGLMEGLFFGVALLGMLVAVANPYLLPVLAAGVAAGFIVYKAGIVSKITSIVGRIMAPKIQLNDEQMKGKHMLMNEYRLTSSQAKQVVLMEDHEKDIYHHIEGTHDEKMEVIVNYQQMHKNEQEVFHDLKDRHDHTKIMKHIQLSRFDSGSYSSEEYKKMIEEKMDDSSGPKLKM